MSRWKYYNPNPANNRVSDCPIRAICKALDMSWEDAFAGVMVKACAMSDMPNADHVWGAYLRDNGFRRHIVDDHGQVTYTVNDFCRDHPHGLYVLCPHGHVVTAVDGEYWDSWDSGDEVPIYYFAR